MGASLSVTFYLLSASRGWVGEVPGGIGFLLSLIVFAMQTAGLAALYRYVPNTHVRWEHAAAGALFVSVGLELAQKVLALYLSNVPVYATVYGAFAAVPIFLIWIYVSWLIILQGAVVAAYAPSLVSRVKRWPDAPGHRFQMALAILRKLVDVQHSPQAGYTTLGLSQMLRTDPLQIEPIVETLAELGWVARLDEPEAEEGGRYVLLADPARTALAPLVRLLLLQADDWTGPFWHRARFDELCMADALGQTPGKDAA
ncbi:MAG: YihY family inner membrane protein [Rubrivivax sp.]|nr:MAG: YihY family inner membrane protein [Rubrivivax sp.]